MSFHILQPTATETPDATLGGNAVSSITNTGHGSTVTSSLAIDTPPPTGVVDNDVKSARWFTFQQVGGQKVSVRLKFSWTASGDATANADDGDASSSADFQIDYTLNGGGAWITQAIDTCSASPGVPGSFTNNNSADIALANDQDISQVQVRSRYATFASATAGALVASASASVTVTISGIQIEATVYDESPIVIS